MCLECPESMMGIITAGLIIPIISDDMTTTMTLLHDWHDRWYIFLSHIHYHSHSSVMKRRKESAHTHFLMSCHHFDLSHYRKREKSAKTYERTWRTKAKWCHLMAWVHQKENHHIQLRRVKLGLSWDSLSWWREWLINHENIVWGRDYQFNWINLHLHIIPY